MGTAKFQTFDRIDLRCVDWNDTHQWYSPCIFHIQNEYFIQYRLRSQASTVFVYSFVLNSTDSHISFKSTQLCHQSKPFSLSHPKHNNGVMSNLQLAIGRLIRPTGVCTKGCSERGRLIFYMSTPTVCQHIHL